MRLTQVISEIKHRKRHSLNLDKTIRNFILMISQFDCGNLNSFLSKDFEPVLHLGLKRMTK